MFNRKSNQIEQLQHEVVVMSDKNTALESKQLEFNRVQLFLARKALDSIHDLTFQRYGGLPCTKNVSDEYDLSQILAKPHRHAPGRFLAVRFTDAAFFQFTSKSVFSDKINTFKLTHKPKSTEYSVVSFNTDSQAIEAPAVVTSDFDEMLSDQRFMMTLGSLTTQVEASHAIQWDNRINDTVLQRALKTTDQVPSNQQ